MAVTMDPSRSETAVPANSGRQTSEAKEKRSMDTESIEITLVWRRLLVYWIGLVILLSTFPWILGSPYWEGVVWTPFHGVRHSFRLLFDAWANVCLYIPLGLAFVQQRPASVGWSIVEAGMLAMLLSVGCELYQVFSPWRYPTMTDVVTNTLGALIGAALGIGLHGRKLVLVFSR